MTDLHVDNTLYLLHAVACAYLRAHHLTRREFGVADDRWHILKYVASCPSRFDALPEDEMVKEIDAYVGRCS